MITMDDTRQREYRNLALALKPFIKLSERMPLRTVQALLTVASYPGKSVSWYADRCETSMSAMSRALMDLGERNRHFEDGFGLVDGRNNLRNMRERIYELTPAGDKFLSKMLDQIK